MFGDLLTKMKAFIDKSKQEKLEKNIFIDEWQIFNDFFNLMEKYEKKLTDEDLVVVKRGMKLFISAVHNVDPDAMLKTDLDYAKEIFYMYFNLINIANIKNYLTNAQMPDDLKILYRVSISRILTVMRKTFAFTDLGLNDPQRPTNCIELLSLMLNYVKTDLESSDLTSNPEPIDASITRQGILEVLWNYADCTILVPDLIEAGCLEIMIDGLIMICK
jgi:Fe-S cluster assembly iron-binding protein IscA